VRHKITELACAPSPAVAPRPTSTPLAARLTMPALAARCWSHSGIGAFEWRRLESGRAGEAPGTLAP
jgi:hypothetical protein